MRLWGFFFLCRMQNFMLDDGVFFKEKSKPMLFTLPSHKK